MPAVRATGRPRVSARAGHAPFRGPLVLAVCAVLVLVLGWMPSRLGAQQLPNREVVSLRFEGNETFPSDSLARAIATRETECRSWLLQVICPLDVDFALNRGILRTAELPRDRARLVLWYRLRGFRDVQVDTALVAGDSLDADVLFRITEGTPVLADSIEYLGLEGVDAGGVLDDLPIQEGDRLSTLTLDATRDTIIHRLANRGYAYVDVFRSALRPAADPYAATVTFEIVPGPASTYGELRITGLSNLEEATVLRTLQISPGDTYRQDEIQEASARLYGLDIIRSASVVADTLPEQLDSIIDIDITIQEGDAYRVRSGVGWSSSECMNVDARWTSRNFLGGGRSLEVRGRVGNILAGQYRDILCTQSGQDQYADLTGLVSVDFVQPWIMSTRNSLSASLYVERQSLPDIFVRSAVGGQLALSRVVAPQTLLSGFYRPEISDLDADGVLFCTGFLVCTPSDVAILEGANWLSPVGLNLSRDRSDDLLDPRSGYRIFVDYEHAGVWTASDYRYDRIVAEASRYDLVGRSVFATRMRAGWVGNGRFTGSLVGVGEEDVIHPQKRFYSGGANSVRGFAQSRLGPRVLFAEPGDLLAEGDPLVGGCTPEQIVFLTCEPGQDTFLDPRPVGGTRVVEANAEIRFPLPLLSLEGVVFTDVGQAWGASESMRLSDLEFTPGLGLRFPTPVGPIRLDVAYRFRDREDLPIVTDLIRPFEVGVDDESDAIEIRVTDAAGNVTVETIDWVATGQLVTLMQPFPFGGEGRGFQLHVSIGQAF